MTALSVEEFGRAVDELTGLFVVEEWPAEFDATRARVLDAYAAVCRERDEWAHLKDAIGRDLSDALGRVQELTDEVGRLRAIERRARAMFPLFEEARDALPAISEVSRKLRAIIAEMRLDATYWKANQPDGNHWQFLVSMADRLEALASDVARLRSERDEAVEALREAVSVWDKYFRDGGTPDMQAAGRKLRAALAGGSGG